MAETRIVQINRRESGGGVARIAGYVHQIYRRCGFDAHRIVDYKESQDPTVQCVNAGGWTAKLLSMPNDVIIHLHGPDTWEFFDLDCLPKMTQRFATILHLHDAWLLSGGCSHSLDCENWKTGCRESHCRLGKTLPLIEMAWKHKLNIFSQSRLYVITPCQWLMDKAKQSILRVGMIGGQVIPNGVDLSFFRPGHKREARQRLGLPQNVPIVLFVNQGAWRDYPMATHTIRRVYRDTSAIILNLGGGLQISNAVKSKERVVVMGKVPPTEMAAYYQAADIYVHPALADTFPNVVLEALACGLPVIATAVGGIPEQVRDGETGFLVKSADEMVDRVLYLLGSPETRKQMGEAAAQDARRRFGLDRMARALVGGIECE